MKKKLVLYLLAAMVMVPVPSDGQLLLYGIASGVSAIKEHRQKKKAAKQKKMEGTAPVTSSAPTNNGNSVQKTPVNNTGDSQTVTLVTTGIAATSERAKNEALRSAIEQAFGTFVSANTQILNDEIAKDEIVSISSGNIQNYNVISETVLEGKYHVTLQATVSIGKLVSFAKSKGASTELAGATFLKNIRQLDLRKKNELSAIKNLYKEIWLIAQNTPLFDYSINTPDPKIIQNEEERKYRIEAKIYARPNNNYYIALNKLISVINVLTLPYELSKFCDDSKYKTYFDASTVVSEKGGEIKHIHCKFLNENTINWLKWSCIILESWAPSNCRVYDNVGHCWAKLYNTTIVPDADENNMHREYYKVYGNSWERMSYHNVDFGTSFLNPNAPRWAQIEDPYIVYEFPMQLSENDLNKLTGFRVVPCQSNDCYFKKFDIPYMERYVRQEINLHH